MTRTPAGSQARSAALAILSEVLRKRRPLDAVEHGVFAARDLSERDAGFARAIAHETLRRLGELDTLLRGLVPKSPAPHKAGPTLEILLAGACELLFLDVAPHAAVDGANRLAAADPKAAHFKPLINAVLRRIATEGQAALSGLDQERINTPDWLWQRWCDAYGEDIARAIGAAHLQTPPVDIVGADQGAFAQAVTLPGGVVRLRETGRIEALPGYEEGRWWVQDFAASLPARLFGDVRGQTVIDLCAAPGGKTVQLARAGAKVIAVEREVARASLMRANLARLRVDADVVETDLRDFASAPQPFVLLDAPCSATGTIRRHPDLPWIKSAADVGACADTASELLDAAADLVAKDGILVFAVCSLEPEEGPEQIVRFLKRRPDFVRIAISESELFGLSPLLAAEGDLRTLPCHLADLGGMDGFYAARLKRIR